MNRQDETDRPFAGVKPANTSPTPTYQATRLQPATWAQVRNRVLNAYEGRCCGCGRTIADAYAEAEPHGPGLWATCPLESDWHAHHRLPVVMGGGGARNPDEFLLLCRLCHDRESAQERRSQALRNYLLHAHRVLRTLRPARFPRPLLRQDCGIARDKFNQNLRWLYRTDCIAGDAKSIGLTERGEAALRQLDIHCRPTSQAETVGSRRVHWFANGKWHPWLRPHLALLIAAECSLLPPAVQPILPPCSETTDDLASSIRLAAHLIERVAATRADDVMLPALDVGLVGCLIHELYAYENWLYQQVRYRSNASRSTETQR